jgi:hypothetical protein
MDIFRLLDKSDFFLAWTLVLILCLLIMLGTIALYLFNLARAKVRRRSFWLLALPLIIIGIWGGKVGFDAYHLYYVYNSYSSNLIFNPSFISISSSPTDGTTPWSAYGIFTFDMPFSPMYVFQLYSLIFLLLAGIILLLRYTLQLRLALAHTQPKSAPLLEEESEPESEEYDEPEGYTVEEVSFDRAKQVPPKRR